MFLALYQVIKEKTDLLKGSDVGECEQTGIFPDVLRLLFVQSESILHGPQQPFKSNSFGNSFK